MAQFKGFKHTHPFMLQLFDFVNKFYSTSSNPKQDKDCIAKYCQLIEVFSFNTINLLLIERLKGYGVLMNSLMHFTKDFKQEDV